MTARGAGPRLLERMIELAKDPASPWEAIGDHGLLTVRFTETIPTPEINRGRGFGRWDEPTYQRLTFLTLVAGKVIIRTCRAPWVSASDDYAPYWLAEAILEDPELGMDWERQRQMREARKQDRLTRRA